MKPVFVLSMHRSGSSVVTMLLNRMGLDLGAAADQLEATVDNELGYGELRRLTSRNESILAAQGYLWSGPPDLDDDVWRHLARGPNGQDARLLLAGTFTREETVIKDPRLCILLPYWVTALEVDPTLVLSLRHPMAIARSLRARDGLAIEHGLLLWERYLRRALVQVNRHGAVVAHYEELLEDPARASGALGDYLTRRGFVTVHPVSEDVAATLVRSDLDHNRVPDQSPGVELSVAQQRLLGYLTALPTVIDPGSLNLADLGPETENSDVVFSAHALAARLATAYEITRRELHDSATRTSELRRARDEMERLREEAIRQREEATRQRELAAGLSARVAELELSIRRLQGTTKHPNETRPTAREETGAAWREERRRLLAELAALRQQKGAVIVAALRDD